MTVHQGYAREQHVGRNDGNLSRHIGTWGENAREYGSEEGWSHLSFDSSEMEKVASPFDDIGFLAGGPSAADPLPPPKTQAKKEHAIPKQRPTVVSNTNNSTVKKNPAIGRFLEKESYHGSPGSTNDNRTSHSRTSGGRLDKTLSTRDMFRDEEASLALLLALGDEDKKDFSSEDKRDNGKSRRVVQCDVSVASLGLSVLGASKAKISEDSRGTSGSSKTSFFTAMTSQNASKNRSFDTSKSSISGLFGSSKSSTSAAPPLSKQTKSSKFLIMKRKETPEKKLEKSEEKVVRLETENVELSKENCMLRAKLEELDGLAQHQKTMMEWISIEQLASVTTEMWQHQSKALLANVHIDKLEAKLDAFQRLVDSKERSINNLEKIRNKQDQRIGYLEVRCLQNGLDVSEEKRRSLSPEIRRPVLLNLPVDPDVQTDEYFVGVDLCPAINHSNRTQTTGVSDISDESEMEENPAKPNSWDILNMELDTGGGAVPRNKPLETFLVANEVHTEPCLETGTWDPTKNLAFSDRHSTSRQVVGVDTFPPMAQEHRAHTPPAPTGRKQLIQSHSTKSKSPGRRRRLKGTSKSESLLESSGPVDNGSSSAGSRRKVKEPSTTNVDPTLKRSSSSNSITMRRTAKAASRNNDKWADPLGSSSTHSLGNRRRLRGKKDAEVDRLAVSSALDKALGLSATELDEIPHDFEHYAMPTTKIRRAVSEGGSRVRGVPSGKAGHEAEEEDDDGLGLLDAVFQE